MSAEFSTRFEDSLQTIGEALQDSGYEVNGYSASVGDQKGIQHSQFAEDPETALTSLLAELEEDDNSMFFYIGGEELAEAAKGERDLQGLIYRNIRGTVQVDEPLLDQPDWADEPLDNPIPAFGTDVIYVPEFPDDYWEVRTNESQPPYTWEDAEERVDDIISVIEQAGHTAEKGHIG